MRSCKYKTSKLDPEFNHRQIALSFISLPFKNIINGNGCWWVKIYQFEITSWWISLNSFYISMNGQLLTLDTRQSMYNAYPWYWLMSRWMDNIWNFRQESLENYGWITFEISDKTVDPEERRYVRYYQWVCFCLFFQVILTPVNQSCLCLWQCFP